VIDNRRYGAPVLVDQNGTVATRLTRLPLDARKIREFWLQDLIRRHPEILPVGNIEPAFSPLISVGMEVPTAVGSIDNLYVSPSGYVTLAETKLWRNPEARREVVGQIIDYAKDLRRWSFQDLDERVRAYNKVHRGGDIGILETLRLYEQLDEQDEASIVDTISRNLERGRLLLLVVGDGIRESVEEMAAFLQSTPQLHYTLALVELEIYKFDHDPDADRVLVVPQIVAKTSEVVRAVVRVEGPQGSSIQVGVDTGSETKKTGAKRSTLTESDYYSQLAQNVPPDQVAFAKRLASDMEGLGCRIDWKQGSYVAKLRDPAGSGNLISIIVVPTDGRTWIGPMGEQLKRLGLTDDIAIAYARDTARLFPGIVPVPNDPTAWKGAVTLEMLQSHYDEFLAVVRGTLEQIKTLLNSDEEST
jgi:hypothetical protein